MPESGTDRSAGERQAYTVPSRAGAVLARAGGAALGATTALVAAVRGAPKPLHPRGRYHRATLTRFGSVGWCGVDWLDKPGVDRAVVRHSTALGMRRGLPDVQGLAVQLGGDGEGGHLLFANTGLGRLARFVLTASTRIDGRPYTTLLPYRAPTGPIVLGLQPQTATTFTLLWARGAGSWNSFGSLVLDAPYDGPPISFDPVQRTVPGLVPYEWVRALREPSYRVARSHRGEDREG